MHNGAVKYYTKLAIVFFTILSGLFLQGCGDSSTDFVQSSDVNNKHEESVETIKSKTITAKVGETVLLEVPKNDMEQMNFDTSDDLTISWILISNDDIEEILDSSVESLELKDLVIEDSATYVQTISDGSSKLIFSFHLSVEAVITPEPPVEPPTVEILGTYRGYFIVKDKKHLFITTKEITEKSALNNCKLNAKNNPKKSILCTFNDKEIFNRIVEPKPNLGTYRGYFIVKNKKSLFITTRNITRAKALDNCKINAKNNPKKSILCTFNDKEIFNRIVEPKPNLGTYRGYFIVKNKKSLFITTRNITRAKALDNCKINAKNNPKKSILCTFNGKTIFKAKAS